MKNKLLTIVFTLLMAFLASGLFAGSLVAPEPDDDGGGSGSLIPYDAPKNLVIQDLTNNKDRNGALKLTWKTFYINGKPAEKYEIIVLSQVYPYLNDLLLPYDSYLVIDPSYYAPGASDRSKNTQSVMLDLLDLMGPNGEGVRPLFKNKFNKMKRGGEVEFYIAIRATNIIDATSPYALDESGAPIYIPSIGPDGRQKKNSDGTWATERMPNYSFVGAYFSDQKKVNIKLDPEPEKLKVFPLERLQDASGLEYVDKEEITGPIYVKIGLNETQYDLNNFSIFNGHGQTKNLRIYRDGDGILDLRWEKSANGNLPNYPIYQIQISKWPDFYFEPEFVAKVDRYFVQEENVHYIYGPQNFVNGQDYSQFFKDLENKILFQPFYGKNLAVKGFEKDSNGKEDFGKPIYYGNDEYGAIDEVNGEHSIYYLRIRALGKNGQAQSQGADIKDLRYGPWSDIIAVQLDKNDRLPSINFTNSPQEIDNNRDAEHKLLPTGNAPLNWELNKKGAKNPIDDENADVYPVYELLVSQNPDIVKKDGKLIDGFRIYTINEADKAGTAHDFLANDFILTENLGIGTFGDPHYIKNLFNKSKNKVDEGNYYFWLRTHSYEPDAIPSVWSQPTSVFVNALPGAPTPVLTRPINNEGIDEAIVPLNWYFNEPGDGVFPTISYYQIFVYKENVNPNDHQFGFLKQDDANNNGINDWEETLSTGGKVYAVYMVSKDDLQKYQQSHTGDAFNNQLYDVNLASVYNLAVDNNGNFILDDSGNLTYKQELVEVKKGEYHFYIRVFNNQDMVSKLSNVGSANITKDIEPPSQAIIVDPTIGNAPYNSEKPWLVPVNWRFAGYESSNPDGDAYGLKEDSFPYDYYQIIVYRQGEEPVDSSGNLLYADEDNDNVNDYEQVFGSGKAYAIYNVGKDALGSGNKTNPYFMANLGIREYYNVSADLSKKDFQPVAQAGNIPTGEYRFYVRTFLNGIPGKCSLPGYYFLDKEASRPATPELFDPANTGMQDASRDDINFWNLNGLVPITWKINGSFENIKDYPVYELITSQTSDTILLPNNEIMPKEIYARDFISSQDLHLADKPFFLKDIFIKKFEPRLDAEGNITAYIPELNQELTSGTYTFYFWLRAFSDEKSGIPGQWSNLVSATLTIGERQQLEKPIITKPHNNEQVKLSLVPTHWAPIKEHIIYELQVSRDSAFPKANRLPSDYLQVSKNAQGQILDPAFVKDLSIINYDEQGRPVYFNNKQYDSPDGDYYFRLRAMGIAKSANPSQGTAMPSEWSNTIKISLVKGPLPGFIYLYQPGELIPPQPEVDKNGIVGLKWIFTKTQSQNDPAFDYDNIGKFPFYEVQISKNRSDFPDDRTAINVTDSGYLVSSVTGVAYPGAFWVKNLRAGDLINKSQQNIPFEDDKDYYFRVRALSNGGWPSISGPWSNSIKINVDLASKPPVPFIGTNPDSVNGVLSGSANIFYDDLTVGRFYDVKCGNSRSEINTYNIGLYEIWEGKNIVAQEWKQKENAFFLKTNATYTNYPVRRYINGGIAFAGDNPPDAGNRYYYRARGWNKALSNNSYQTPDRLDDAIASDWSGVAAVDIPQGVSASSLDTEHRYVSAAKWRK